MKMDLLNKFQSLVLTKALLKLSEEVNKPSNNSISSSLCPPKTTTTTNKQKQTNNNQNLTKKPQTQQLAWLIFFLWHDLEIMQVT